MNQRTLKQAINREDTHQDEQRRIAREDLIEALELEEIKASWGPTKDTQD